MKKILIFGIVFVAIASIGGNRINIISAHAETLTPAQAASLQASLDVLKAKLVTLEAEANARHSSPAVSGAPLALQATPLSLSNADVASLRGALTALAGMLTELGAKFSANPQFAAQNSGAVLTALQGIGNTLAMIGTSLGSSNFASGASPAVIAQAAPPASPISMPAPQPKGTPFSASNPVAIVSGANDRAQTAEVSSAWSLGKLNWPLVAVTLLALAAMVLWLWWPASENSKNSTKKSASPVPARAAQPTIVVSSGGPRAASAVRQAAASPPTPLATAMAAPTEDHEVPIVKIIPPQQQRKSA